MVEEPLDGEGSGSQGQGLAGESGSWRLRLKRFGEPKLAPLAVS